MRKRYPNLNEEKKLWKGGYKRVVCIDEAGRGPLAGPVTAAAVFILNTKYKIPRSNPSLPLRMLRGKQNTKIRDSKKLSPKQRENFYNLITKNKNMGWGVGIVSEKVIDKINIKNAAELAMEKAMAILNIKNLHPRRIRQGRKKTKINFLIIDGNHINSKKLKKLNHKLIVKADEKVFSCAAASILAKVTRDRIMARYHKKFPQYRFDLHKGYPTRLHLKMLKKYGPCKIHRKSFKPVIKNSKLKAQISKP